MSYLLETMSNVLTRITAQSTDEENMLLRVVLSVLSQSFDCDEDGNISLKGCMTTL
jgi:hypothetical protein